MSRSKSLNKIREILSIFSEKIRIGTENQELDDNIHAENIFTNVLNSSPMYLIWFMGGI